mmetsp:Transcript_237/g.917  ORF Transcript_237/g.917 Transcript_237/m.917 type:complete len:296 (+) Transcript_237:74-961(+)
MVTGEVSRATRKARSWVGRSCRTTTHEDDDDDDDRSDDDDHHHHLEREGAEGGSVVVGLCLRGRDFGVAVDIRVGRAGASGGDAVLDRDEDVEERGEQQHDAGEDEDRVEAEHRRRARDVEARADPAVVEHGVLDEPVLELDRGVRVAVERGQLDDGDEQPDGDRVDGRQDFPEAVVQEARDEADAEADDGRRRAEEPGVPVPRQQLERVHVVAHELFPRVVDLVSLADDGGVLLLAAGRSFQLSEDVPSSACSRLHGGGHSPVDGRPCCAGAGSATLTEKKTAAKLLLSARLRR